MDSHCDHRHKVKHVDVCSQFPQLVPATCMHTLGTLAPWLGCPVPAAMMHAHVLSFTVWVGDSLTRRCIVEDNPRHDQTRWLTSRQLVCATVAGSIGMKLFCGSCQQDRMQTSRRKLWL